MLEDADIASLDFGAAGNWIVLSSALMLGFRLALGDHVGPLLLAGMALVAVGLYLLAKQPRTGR